MDDDDAIEVATITIRKVLTDDDTCVHVEATDEQGDDLSLVEVLGLLEFAKFDWIEHMVHGDDGGDE